LEFCACHDLWSQLSIENQLKTIDEKFANLQNQLEERAKKVDQELEQVSELFAYVYQGNKENAAEIKDIKKIFRGRIFCEVFQWSKS
jgi:hypothetical protein